jgi:hypothetical protein
MTTKNTAATLDINTVTVSGVPPSPVPKPNTAQVSGSSFGVLQQVVHLCRAGYTVDTNVAVFTNPETGMMSISMVIGSPEQAFIDAANETLKDAQAAQDARYYRDVEHAAKRQIEAAERAKKDAKKAELLAAHEAALKAMQAELDAM